MLTQEKIEEIRKYPRLVDWYDLCSQSTLSEEFMREFAGYIWWDTISFSQKLSEDFIKDFRGKLTWYYISKYQDLSENFIREFKDKVDWGGISIYQKLSEDFIREFKDNINGDYISKYQKLSEDFIREFKDKVDWDLVSKYQRLSETFREEFDLGIPVNSWMYKPKGWKENYIRENTDYKIKDGKVIAYKSCRSSGYSRFTFRYLYEIGKEYESHADYNADNDNSFGLSAWSKKKALEYYNLGKLFKVEIDLDDVACIVQEGNKIRAKKLKILEEIDF